MRIATCLMALCGMVAMGLFHTPAAADEGGEKHIVQYRLAKWETVHFNDKAKADKFAETLKKLECDVEVKPHAGHFDVTYRCVDWRQIVFPKHDEATKWELWLDKIKFETKHVH